MQACQSIEALLSAYLDGELTQQDRQRVEVHVDACEACHAALAELRRIRDGIGGLHHPEPTAEQWSRMMKTTVAKTSRGLGWMLGIGGGVVLVGYGAYTFATDESVAALKKVGVAAFWGGLGLLLLSVLIDRLRDRKSDRYKDVEL